MSTDAASRHAYEIDRLRREHQALQQQLEGLEKRPHLSDAEQVERRRLQKLKLAKKDALLQLGGC